MVDVEVFFAVFSLVFVAEMGDKTQLAVMALASRQPWRPVFGGAALAFALLNVLAVGVGQALFRVLPLFWIKLAAGALFAVFGLMMVTGQVVKQRRGRAKM